MPSQAPTLSSPSLKKSLTKGKPSKSDGDRTFRDDVLAGFAASPKQIASKYFYDQRGSQLFDEICELDEYYVTRCELQIMESDAPAMAEALGPRVRLVEFGSGSSVKTRLLIDELIDPAGYLPVDVSHDHLQACCEQLREDYPDLEVLPVTGDFTGPLDLARTEVEPETTAVYFPGSTIGNFERREIGLLLERIRRLAGDDGALLLGVDLQKDPEVIHAAYNDSEGVTAEFNRNLLHRINRELDGDIDPDTFAHRAEYSEQEGRIEASLVSDRDQTVTVAGEEFSFDRGEAIHTEYSHKFVIEELAEDAADRGFRLRDSWTDDRGYFAVLLFDSI